MGIRDRVSRLTKKQPARLTAQVIIFDAFTGEPLPGSASNPEMRTQFWLPAKTPDAHLLVYPGGYSNDEEGHEE